MRTTRISSAVGSSLAFGPPVLLIGAAVLLSATACLDQGGAFEEGDDFDDWVREGPALREELRPHFEAGIESLVTRPIGVGRLYYDRVGFMFDAEKTPEISVRVSLDSGETFTDWVPATINFQEGEFHNGHADVPFGGSYLQLRFGGIEPEQLSYLHVDAFVFTPEPIFQANGHQELELHRQELAATAGVDVTRAQWGARATQCSTTHSPYRMTIHHTVTPNNDSDMAARMRGMQTYHMDSRGYCDLGYHFTVGQDGKVYQGRAEGYLGAHVGGANTGNTGISFIGTFSTVVPSSSMMDAGAKIIRAVADYYQIAINRDRVRGHREYGSTECPGDAFYPKMDELVALAQDSGGGEATGTVRGVVFWIDDPAEFSTYVGDASRRLAGATVTFNPGSHTAPTGSDGYYQIEVPAGTYSVRASAAGYDDGIRSDDVTVIDGQTNWGSVHVLVPGGGVVISFPTDGEVLEDEVVIVLASTTVPDLERATINGIEAGLAGDGTFSAAVHLEPGENVIEAIAYGEDDREVGRASVTVSYAGSGCGCATGAGSGAGGVLFTVVLFGATILHRRRH